MFLIRRTSNNSHYRISIVKLVNRNTKRKTRKKIRDELSEAKKKAYMDKNKLKDDAENVEATTQQSIGGRPPTKLTTVVRSKSRTDIRCF